MAPVDNVPPPQNMSTKNSHSVSAKTCCKQKLFGKVFTMSMAL